MNKIIFEQKNNERFVKINVTGWSQSEVRKLITQAIVKNESVITEDNVVDLINIFDNQDLQDESYNKQLWRMLNKNNVGN